MQQNNPHSFIAGTALSFIVWSVSWYLHFPFLLLLVFGLPGLVFYKEFYWEASLTLHLVLLSYALSGFLFLGINAILIRFYAKRSSAMQKGMHVGYLFVLITAVIAFIPITQRTQDVAQERYIDFADFSHKTAANAIRAAGIDRCDYLRIGNPRASCVAVFAVDAEDPSQCLTLSDDAMPYYSQKDACLWEVAWKKQYDETVCSYMQDPTSAGRCLAAILQKAHLLRENQWRPSLSKQDMVSMCEKMNATSRDASYRGRCFREVALEFADPAICGDISNADEEYDLCIFKAAFRAKSDDACKNIHYEPLKNQCTKCVATEDPQEIEFCVTAYP